MKEAIELIGVDAGFLYETFIQSTDDYIYLGNLRKNLYVVSDNILRDLEINEKIMSDMFLHWLKIVHPEDQEKFCLSIERLLLGTDNLHNLEYRLLNRKKEWIWVQCRGVMQRDDQGLPVFFSGIITPLQTKGKVNYLTGIFSRSECEKYLNFLFEKKRGTAGGALLLLGLDNFSQINHLHGHQKADQILRCFAQDVQNLLTYQAKFFYYDTDRFAIVTEDGGKKEIDAIYSRVHYYANQYHEIGDFRYYCSVSGGVAFINQDAEGFLDLMNYAVYALEFAKQKGKNQVQCFVSYLLRDKEKGIKLESALQEAVLNDCEGFSLVFQPQILLKQMTIKGTEALVRFNHKEYGNILPVEFIPILEKTGLIHLVGKWIFEEAVKTCKSWISYFPDFVMSVNISYLQFADPTLSDFILQTLMKYNLEPKHIVLELTESCLISNLEMLNDQITFFQQMGIEVAMDDFGSGYSNLSLLMNAYLNIIKVDRILTQGMRSNKLTLALVEKIVKICHEVNICVCMEGVEDIAEIEVLKQMGVDMIQGYLLSKPLGKEEFIYKFCDVSYVNL